MCHPGKGQIMKSEKKLTPKKYRWLNILIIIGIVLISLELGVAQFISTDIRLPLAGTILIVVLMIVYRVCVQETYRLAREMEWLLRNKDLVVSHLENNGHEVFDYYPSVWYQKSVSDNAFYLKFRLDGTDRGERLRELEQPLSDAFETVCTDVVYERGYIIYEMELEQQAQLKMTRRNKRYGK